jgi:hypothetical protein
MKECKEEVVKKLSRVVARNFREVQQSFNDDFRCCAKQKRVLVVFAVSSVVFGAAALCSLMVIDHCFGGTSWLHLQG